MKTKINRAYKMMKKKIKIKLMRKNKVFSK